MTRRSLARTYSYGVAVALAAHGVLALLERNPQATAMLVVASVLMGVALAHAAAVARGPAGALTFMHHLSGAAISVAVAATAFAAAYLLNKDTDTPNLFAMSLALVHLALAITMLLSHVAAAYADLHVMHGAAGDEMTTAAGAADLRPHRGREHSVATAPLPACARRWRLRAATRQSS